MDNPLKMREIQAYIDKGQEISEANFLMLSPSADSTFVFVVPKFLSILNFICILKIILVHSKDIFFYINWLIGVNLKCFELSLKL